MHQSVGALAQSKHI